MPANRSRTENFLANLQDIADRGGAVEICFDPSGSSLAIHWRVRLLRVEQHQLVIATPGAAGVSMPVRVGAPVVASYTIGQNRWAFSTTVRSVHPDRHAPERSYLVVDAPKGVERKARRTAERFSTGQLGLPQVDLWPLMDPTTVVEPERRSRVLLEAALSGGAPNTPVATTTPSDQSLPLVGPGFSASLINLSAGGLGLSVPQQFAGTVERHAFLWARLHLDPLLPAPLSMTLRRAHSHLDSSGQVYLGAAFESAFNPGHNAFIADTLSDLLARLQSADTASRARPRALKAA
jgi:hypothetical protein